MKKEGNQYFEEVSSHYTDPDTGNICIDAYLPDDENGRVVAQVTPDGEVVPGTNPECKAFDLHCVLVKEAIEKAKQAQAELKEELVDVVLEELGITTDAFSDVTVISELLTFVPVKNLIQSLPEEKWEEQLEKYPMTIKGS